LRRGASATRRPYPNRQQPCCREGRPVPLPGRRRKTCCSRWLWWSLIPRIRRTPCFSIVHHQASRRQGEPSLEGVAAHREDGSESARRPYWGPHRFPGALGPEHSENCLSRPTRRSIRIADRRSARQVFGTVRLETVPTPVPPPVPPTLSAPAAPLPTSL